MFIHAEVVQAKLDDLRREADHERLIAAVRRTRVEDNFGATVVRSRRRGQHRIARRVATALGLTA